MTCHRHAVLWLFGTLILVLTMVACEFETTAGPEEEGPDPTPVIAYLYCSTGGQRAGATYVYKSQIIEHEWSSSDSWPDIDDKYLTLFQGYISHNYGASILTHHTNYCNGSFNHSDTSEGLQSNIADTRAKGWDVVLTNWNG